MTNRGKLLLLGVGNAALAVNARAHDYRSRFGTTRRSQYMPTLESVGIKPILISSSLLERSGDEIEADVKEASDGADVLVTFPPDGTADSLLAKACCGARKIVYISSTGVYGSASGVINETTDVDRNSTRTNERLHAEDIWRELGAIVMRAPAIYGRNYGLHVSLAQRKFRIPGDGMRFSSRIHEEDLARIILRAFDVGKKGSLFIVGDLSPVPYIEVVTWLCERLEIPLPDAVPLEQVHYTLQADRQIDPSRVLTDLQIELNYPSYKEGFSQCLS